MRTRNLSVVLLGVLAVGGCAKKKSTEDLLADLKSSREKDRVVAVRLLPQRKGDAVQAVPALIAALKDKESDVRRSAAIGLGNLGESAKESIPALRAAQRDRDARVREAVRVALSRIDPQRFPARLASREHSAANVR
jgi:HEAT repeat protein